MADDVDRALAAERAADDGVQAVLKLIDEMSVRGRQILANQIATALMQLPGGAMPWAQSQQRLAGAMWQVLDTADRDRKQPPTGGGDGGQ